MSYLELDDIIFNIQKFGGASTYWRELTSRLSEFVPGEIVHSTGKKMMRFYSPRSSAKVFHSSHFRISSSRSVTNVTTIHDLIYEKGFGGGRGKFLNLYERRKSVEMADAIICISESTRQDLYKYYAIKICCFYFIYFEVVKITAILNRDIEQDLFRNVHSVTM